MNNKLMRFAQRDYQGGTTMLQEITQEHRNDEDGRPAGGTTTGRGINIEWQNGPLGVGEGERLDPNGAFVEGVIAAAKGRLEYYQSSPFACPENREAIHHLELALQSLAIRTADRVARGVEGTHKL